MVQYITIAVDSTPTIGAGVIVIRENCQTTRYAIFSVPHSYGRAAGTFEIKNAVNQMKHFKRYLDSDCVVKFYCDNTNILNDDNPDTKNFHNQLDQIETSSGCTIEVFHDSISDGNKYLEAANALSRGKLQQCPSILEQMGAVAMNE